MFVMIKFFLTIFIIIGSCCVTNAKVQITTPNNGQENISLHPEVTVQDQDGNPQQCIFTCDMTEGWNTVVQLKEGYFEEESLVETEKMPSAEILLRFIKTIDNLEILTRDSKGDDLNITLYDISGKEIDSINSQLNNSEQSHFLDLNDLSSGAYYVVIKVDNQPVHTYNMIHKK
jgi:hypothetical protein